MTEDQRQEREDWDALIGSPGWQRLVGFADEQWTGAAAFKRRILAGGELASVRGAEHAARQIVEYPLERLRALREKDRGRGDEPTADWRSRARAAR